MVILKQMEELNIFSLMDANKNDVPHMRNLSNFSSPV